MRLTIVGTILAGAVIGWLMGAPGQETLSEGIEHPPASQSGFTAEFASGSSEEAFGERLSKLLAMPSGMKRARAVTAFADGLDAAQVRGSIDEMRRVHVSEQREILNSLYRRWTELEPEVAFAEARDSADYREGLYEVAKCWARSDPDAVKTAVERMPSSGIKKDAVAGLVEALSETNPRQAFELAEKTQTFSNTIETLFDHWMEMNPEDAASYATKLRHEGERWSAIQSVAKTLADSDPVRAIQWLEALPEQDAFPRYGDSPIAQVFARWMDDDIDAALSWMKARPTDPRSTDILPSVCFSVALRTGDPLLATRIVSMLTKDDGAKAMKPMMVWWANHDLDGALTWVQGQPEGMQKEVLPTLICQLANSDPQKAMSLALNANAARGESQNEVLTAWASRDPAAAAEWLRSQPERADYLATIAGGWVLRDADAAAEWINTVKPGAARDQAVSVAVECLEGPAPELAAKWIAGIGDEQKRREASLRLANTWRRDDPEAARKWIQEAPVSEDLRAALQKGVEE